jgi:hypothetical protein
MWVATLFQVGDKSLSVIYLILTHYFDKLNKSFFFCGGGGGILGGVKLFIFFFFVTTSAFFVYYKKCHRSLTVRVSIVSEKNYWLNQRELSFFFLLFMLSYGWPTLSQFEEHCQTWQYSN